MGEIILQVQNLEKRFKKNIKVVDDISFSVEKGDVFGFLGPNGAGKTTTIRMILGLIRPECGEVHINNKSISKDFFGAVSNVGALVEGPAFYEYLTGVKNLEIFGQYSGGVSQSKIHELLELVGLEKRGNDKVKEYSLGMKQRLGIAQALLNDPKLLILDEPTNGLDPIGIKEIRELILRLANQNKITVFISSHILSEVQQMCNKFFIINKGKKVIDGYTDELLKSNANTYFIEADTKEALINAAKKIKGVSILSTDDNKFNLGGNKPQEVLRTLVKDGIGITVFNPCRLTLEDFFLNAVKEELKDEGC